MVTIQEARREADGRATSFKRRITRVSQALSSAVARKEKQSCTICAAQPEITEPHLVIPSGFIATYLVANDMDNDVASLSLRCAWLCAEHRTHFDSLFVDVAANDLDLERLGRRATVLGAVTCGQLIVFGGAKALRVVEEFYADVALVKAATFEDR
jgi:hypothetical protein